MFLLHINVIALTLLQPPGPQAIDGNADREALAVYATVMAVKTSTRSASAPIVGLSVSAAPSDAASSPVQSGRITGRVTDSSGAPVPGATVIAVPATGGVAKWVLSGPDGTYAVDDIAEGVYFEDFELTGFDVTRRNHVRVDNGTTTSADATLYVSGICECVSITLQQSLAPRVGQVLSAFGKPLPHARLRLLRPQAEFAYADAEGRFAVRLPIDEAVPLMVSESGFQSATQQVSGRGSAPVVFRLAATDTESVPETQRLGRPCCPNVLFTHGW